MTEDEFVKLVGARLFHVTLTENLPSIRENGLLRPVTLAERAGCAEHRLVLRDAPIRLDCAGQRAKLNHQKPLLAGQATASEWLDGMTLEEWSAMLDQRCFFWSAKVNLDFQVSMQDRGTTTVLSVDSAEMYRRYFYNMFLSPINSGAAIRKPSPRGRWLYVPVSAPMGTLRANRTKRGLVKAKDKTREISVTGDISISDLLAADLREN